MKFTERLPTLVFAGLFATIALTGDLCAAQDAEKKNKGYPPNMKEAAIEVYKHASGRDLNMYIFTPEDHSPNDDRAVIVFFFGGGWRSGSPQQFHQHARYLSSRGMVVCIADYRVLNRDKVPAVECVRDAKSAVRWVRKNAERLGIDPERIAAGGGSAGGHLAACTGLVPDLDDDSEDTSISSKPNALVLFNPAVILASTEEYTVTKRRETGMKERAGIDPARISPIHYITADAPPTIIFHGTMDETVPFESIKAFAAKMKEAGARCEIVPGEGKSHGYFNYGREKNQNFLVTVSAADRFLANLGYIEGKPSVEEFLK